MAKVGSIKTYHDGAAYDVADIFDQKQNSYTKTSFDTTDATVLLYPKPPDQLIEVCGNIVLAARPSDTDLVTTEHAKFDYAFHTTYNYATTSRPFVFGTTDFTIDGWYYLDLNVANNFTTFFSFCADNTLNASRKVLSCAYNKNTKKFQMQHGRADSVQLYTNEFSDELFNSPFHLAVAFTKTTTNGVRRRLFVNGELAVSDNASNSYMNFTGLINCMIGGSSSGSVLGLYTSMWRYSKIARWTENFTPPSDVFQSINTSIVGDIPIRHNNQTYYAPLVTANNPPCIAVRHNNQTYYTLKG